MTDVPINPCFRIGTRLGREVQSNFEVLYALILGIMSQEFSTDFRELGLIKRRVDLNFDYSFCNRGMLVRGLCQSFLYPSSVPEMLPYYKGSRIAA